MMNLPIPQAKPLLTPLFVAFFLMCSSLSWAQTDLSISQTAQNNGNNPDISTFIVIVRNNGPNPATNVVVSENLNTTDWSFNNPSSNYTVSHGAFSWTGTGNNDLTWNIPYIASGGIVVLTFNAHRNFLGYENRSISVSITSLDQTDSNPSNNTSTTSTTTDYNAHDLALSNIVNDATPLVGQSVQFTITLTKLSGGTNTNPNQVTNKLPPGLTYTGSTASSGTYDSTTGIWSIPKNSYNITTPETLVITATVNAPTGATDEYKTAAILTAVGLDTNVTNNIAIASVSVTPPPPPEAENDGAETAQNIPVDIDILANDTYSILDNITIEDEPLHGDLVINPDNTVTYTPDIDYIGLDSFTYTIEDENGTSDPATVSIEVIPVEAPTAVADNASVFMNQEKIIDVLANDDPGSGAFDEVNIVSGPDHGDLVINPDLTISYTPDNSYTGSDSFTYNVTNIHNATSNNATVNINVTNPVGLVTWNGAGSGFAPNVTASNITASNITSTGVTLDNQGQYSQYFLTNSGWPTPTQNSGYLDTSKYIQVTITPNPNYQINLNQFNFDAQSVGGPANYEIRYSKDSSFATYSFSNGTLVDAQATKSISLSGVNPVLPEETVYIRLYVYYTHNALRLFHSWGGSTGPTITGVVSPYISGDPADLKITKTMEPDDPAIGDEVTYTIVVENLDLSNTASGVMVTDQLPLGFSYVDDTPSVGSYNNGTGVWTVGGLASGGSATLEIVAERLATGPYTNTASVSHNGTDSDSNNDTSSVTPSNACADCTHTIPSGGGYINALAGEVYCLHSGTFTGTFNIQTGGTICIGEGATFSPSGPADPNDLNGTIINRGTMTFPLYSDDGPHTGTILNYGTYNSIQIEGFAGTIQNHGTITNTGITSFLSGANMTNTGIFSAATFQNFPGILTNSGTFTISGTYSFLSGSYFNNLTTATFTIGGSVSGMIDNSGTMSFGPLTQVNGVITNYKTLRFYQDVDIYANTYITNDDLLEFLDIIDPINFQGPMLTNNGLLRVTGSNGSLGMNSDISQMHNNGTIVASGSIFHNVAGSRIVNNCSIECETYVVGNGTSDNNGLILTTGPTNSFQINGGPSFLENGPGAHIQGSGFTNSGRISGYGTFYFTGYTNNQNEFGADSFRGNDPDNPILFYDASPTGPIFDESNGHENVIRPPALEGYITVYSDISEYECTAPPSTAGYPPVTRPIEFYYCETPESLSFDLDNDGTPTPYAQPHPPVDGNNFTLLLSSITLFDSNDQDNEGNNTTSLTIAGKGTLTANTSTGLIEFTPDPAFTNGDTFEAEYRIWNQWSGLPPMHPSARTPITITINALADIETEDDTTFCLGETLELSNPDADGVWSSENESIATVDEDGIVTGVSGGTTHILYTKYFVNGDCSLEKEIEITVNDLAEIETEDNTTFCSGDTIELSNPDAGGVWSSEDESIATVDEDGIVTGVSGGTTHILYTQYFENGDCSLEKEIEITVEDCGYCGYDPASGAALSSVVGISTLNTQLSGWPENVPNGYIVLESKEKGFVITRVADQNAITDPQEGMLIYDMAVDCIKLYNGTAWNCLGEEPECP